MESTVNFLVYIITPIYNRAEMIKSCYKSLLNQTNKRFCWIIVDDGSEDNIQQVADEFISENKLKIAFYSKENAGKHTAINKGLDMIQDKNALVIVLDSDDILTDNAVEIILEYHKKYGKLNYICGYTFLKKRTDGGIWGNWGKHNKNDWISDYIESRINFKKGMGEKADVYYLEALRQNRFSEYSGEKYIGESTIGLKMAEKYKIVCADKIIYIGEYCQDGLTNSGRRLRVKAPLGGMEYSYLRMNKRCRLIERVKSAILFNAYYVIAFRSKKNQIIKYKKYKLLRCFTFFPGVILGIYWGNHYDEKTD